VHYQIVYITLHTHTYIHTYIQHHSNGHFLGKQGLDSCPLDSQCAVILTLSILTDKPKLFVSFST